MGANLENGLTRNYDVSVDGQRFLVVSSFSEADADYGAIQINVVLNWFEELKERVTVP